ncbi:MAG: hypothetical protein B7Y16_06465 [Methylotenera sp. 24-45-7]|nr:MAG: hypothetical protein B7Y72_00280 [Mehylophilales bacterium 35-46-6]OYZ40274.1 MAG: hypothetical protein B7Y16_06465 [Methylotenera sp. 24-45-7]OZA54164.1 MAG: hypothetical protein B7X73_01885 [Methylophilales bacterium 39-45-7]HQS37136.1 DUF6134 family protein [Methylotenera sp.]HQS43373.1 DUF6134 family protein [Methylotenera sp.]
MKTLFFAIFTLLVSPSVMAREWAFDVYLDKTKIGQHTFKLNNAQELVSQAKFNVKVLFINAYQYQHKAVENWQNSCLKNLEANTVENDITTKVKGQLSDGNFVVENGAEKQSLPSCAMTFAYWNQKILQQSKLLNPQNAEWLDTKISKVGTEMLDVKGKKVETTRYKLDASLNGKPKLDIELWYENASNDWVALKSITPEGYTINYKLK